MVDGFAQQPEGSRSSLAPVVRARGVASAGVGMILLGVGLRLWIAARDLSTPLIDENEVVEQAVAFMGGDLEHHFVKYGPLTMYLLSGIYRVMALLHGMSGLEYASRVFLHGEEHYFIARAFTSLSLSALALAAFLHYRRTLGPRAALVTAALLGLPCVDALVTGARIDMPQAALQGGALLALGVASVSDSRRAWLVAGVAAGLGIASKPLPGLLIAPCFPLASWFAVQRDRSGERRRWFVRLSAAVAHPALWLAGAVALAAALIGDPAILHLSDFIASQRSAVALHSGPGLGDGPSIFTSFALLGMPLCAVLLGSLALVVVRGSPPARLVALFFGVYLAAFWGRSRHYFLVAAAVAACLLVSYGVATAEPWLVRRGERARVWLRRAAVPLTALGLLLLVWPPLSWVVERTTKPSARREARDWIYANIPSGTRIYYVGWRPAGPPLVAHKASVQATFGDHFGYGREHYTFLKQAFERGYADYVASGAPRYAIVQEHNKPVPRSSKRAQRRITDGLLDTARKQKRQYIIIAGHNQLDVRALGYPWFARAELVREFGTTAIFRVPEERLTAEASAGALREGAPAAAVDSGAAPRGEGLPGAADTSGRLAGPPGARAAGAAPSGQEGLKPGR